MSEQPETNGQAPAPQAPAVEDKISGFELFLAIVAIVAGAGIIIMGLDTATNGRLLGFATQEEQQP